MNSDDTSSAAAIQPGASAPGSSGHQEVELKLSVPPETVARLRRHPLLTGLTRNTRRLDSTYFDSPDLALLKRNLSLRVRKLGRRHVQTLKEGPLQQAGLFKRKEFEQLVRGDHPDPARIDDPDLRDVVERVGRKQGLQPIFGTSFRRTSWRITLGERTAVQATLDVGEVRAGQATEPVCELELELEKGEAEDLIGLARRLCRDLPLGLGGRSKAAIGYALYSGEAAEDITPRRVPLAEDATTGEAALAIIDWCLREIVTHQPAALEGSDPEGVHQVRVATRRLRSALGFFGPLFEVDALGRLIDELRWLMGELAEAREWDVFLTEMLPPVEATFEGEADAARWHRDMGRIADHARELRETSYQRVRAALAHERYFNLVISLRLWVDRPPWRVDAPAPTIDDAASSAPAPAERGEPMIGFARRMLEHRHRRVRKLGRRAGELEVTELHRLRIRMKKLRYLAEFTRVLFDKQAAKPYLKAAARVQEALGHLNDTATVHKLVARLKEGDGDPALDLVYGRIEGWFAALATEGQRNAAPLMKGFLKTERFWA
jgi:inorganic triphosphatase YgiF